MVRTSPEDASEELGGVNFFRVTFLEDRTLEQDTRQFEKTAANEFPLLRFALASFDKPDRALEHLYAEKKKYRNIHLFMVDYDFPGAQNGADFVQVALSEHPQAFFAFSTRFLHLAWGQLGEIAKSSLQEFQTRALDNQLHPYLKEKEGTYKDQIAHFLAKYRARVVEGRRQPTNKIIITTRECLSRPKLKFVSGIRGLSNNAWLATPVDRNEAQGDAFFTDDPLIKSPEGGRLSAMLDTALVIYTPRRPGEDLASAGVERKPAGQHIRNEPKEEELTQTYFARRLFRSVFYAATPPMFPSKTFNTLDPTNAAIYASCFNMNLLWLGKRRRQTRFVTKNDKGAYELLEPLPAGLFVPGLAKSTDAICDRFNALGHLYRHFRAETFFLDQNSEWAGPGTVRTLADLPEGEGGMNVGEDAEVYVDMGTSDPVAVYTYKEAGSPRAPDAATKTTRSRAATSTRKRPG